VVNYIFYVISGPLELLELPVPPLAVEPRFEGRGLVLEKCKKLRLLRCQLLPL
jgi:hypothetical protein